ncbi:hypothetical protein C9994_10350, partial [Marivirga lumbricoides]
ERRDLKGAYALDSINIYNFLGERIKAYDLKYSYQFSAPSGNELSHLINIDNAAQHRLFLEEFQQVSDVEKIPPYKMIYNPIPLPNRFSNSQDNWGYFNGADNGPYLTFFNYGSRSINRRVDTLKSEAGLLKKVIYPTGGSLEIEYEHNRGYWDDFRYEGGDDFISDEVFPGNDPIVTNSAGFFKNPSLYNQQYNYYADTLTVGDGLTGDIHTNVSFVKGNCVNGTNTTDCRFLVYLKSLSSTSTYVIKYGSDHYISNVAPGKYLLIVEPIASDFDISDFEDTFNVFISWDEQIDSEQTGGEDIIYGAGKRVSKTRFSTPGQPDVVKKIIYKSEADSYSGLVLGMPNFYSTSMNSTGLSVLEKYGSLPGSPLTSFQGNQIGYSTVQVLNGENKLNGKTIYQFTNFPDGGDYKTYPYHLPIDNEWMRGKLTKREIYIYENDQFQLVDRVENTYLFGEEFSQSAPQTLLTMPPSEGTELTIERTKFYLPLASFVDDGDGGVSFKKYWQIGGFFNIRKEIRETFDSEGNSFIQEMEYEYNCLNHYKLSSKTSKNLIGSKSTIYYYPNDIEETANLGYDNFESSSEYSAINKLKTLKDNGERGYNRLIPIQVDLISSKEGGQGVSLQSTRTIFKEFNSGLVLPHIVEESIGNVPLETRLTYHEYDAIGNLLEFSKANDFHTVYLWGYNNIYPVAQIENATLEEIEVLLNMNTVQLGEGNLSQEAINLLYSKPEYKVSLYDYKVGVGLSGQNDLNRISSKYYYDKLNRLIRIEDKDGFIIEKNSYNYIND